MYLTLSYILLSAIILIILFFLGNYAINKTFSDSTQRKRKKVILTITLLLWHIYLYLMGKSGFLTDLSFPPRYMLFVILPLFIFIGIFMRINRKNNWIQAIPIAWLTFYQSFRIAIETIFVFTVAAGFLHKNVTIEGYNYDFVYACTAFLMTLIVIKSKVIPIKALLLWNYLGIIVILIIILLFIITLYLPEFFGPNTRSFPIEFGLYPYVLVPGFLMPSAVFIHVLSIVQLKNFYKMENKNTNKV